MKELRKQIAVALIRLINGKFGNLLQAVRHNDSETIMVFGRLIESPEIYVKGNFAKFISKDNHLMVVVLMNDEVITIIRNLNDLGWQLTYETPLIDVNVNSLYDELRKAIGYNY